MKTSALRIENVDNQDWRLGIHTLDARRSQQVEGFDERWHKHVPKVCIFGFVERGKVWMFVLTELLDV